MTPAARLQAAIELSEAIDQAPHAPSDATANAWFRARKFIGGSDRRAVSDRVWAMLRQRLRLDWHLGEDASSRRRALAWLVLGEALAPDAAAGLFSGARFGPAALDEAERTLLRRLAGRALVDPAMDDATRLNLPEFLLEGFRARFGAALAEEAAAFDQPATLDLRANLLKGDRDAARTALLAEGLDARPTPFSPWGLRLSGRTPVTGTEAFRQGLVEIQDEGSQLIALLADARPGLGVVDFCAGAGGKTLAMAARMKNSGRLVAADVSSVRLEGAVKRLRRAGIHNVERRLLVAGDKWAKRAAGKYDRVLVDAPCTGTGTWRRNPDARFRLRQQDLAELVTKQGDILDAAARLLKPAGKLVYATCSVLPEENDLQVEKFLARNAAFRLVAFSQAWASVSDAPAPCDGPYLALSPARHGTDGFFAAVMEKVP